MVRSLFPGWRFSNVHKDCSKLVMQAAAACSELWAQWELCIPQDNGIRVADSGTSPILLGFNGERGRSLQDILSEWATVSGGDRALTANKPLILRLGRSTESGKNSSEMDFEAEVFLRVFDEARTSMRPYSVTSGVVHLGRRVISGHYRAILRSNAQWRNADDGVAAAPIAVNALIRSGIYLLWLIAFPEYICRQE